MFYIKLWLHSTWQPTGHFHQKLLKIKICSVPNQLRVWGTTVWSKMTTFSWEKNKQPYYAILSKGSCMYFMQHLIKIMECIYIYENLYHFLQTTVMRGTLDHYFWLTNEKQGLLTCPGNRKSRGGTQSYHSNYSTLWMFYWIGLYLARRPSPTEMPHESPTKVVTIMTTWLSIRHLLQIKISLVFYVLVYIHFTPSFTLVFPLTPILYYEFVLPFSKRPF